MDANILIGPAFQTDRMEGERGCGRLLDHFAPFNLSILVCFSHHPIFFHPGSIHACYHEAGSGGKLLKNSSAWNAPLLPSNPPLLNLRFTAVAPQLSSSLATLAIIPTFPPCFQCVPAITNGLSSPLPSSPPPPPLSRPLTGVKGWHFSRHQMTPSPPAEAEHCN